MHIGIDLDGTLLDSRERHALVLQAAADSLHITLPPGLTHRYVAAKRAGISGREVLEEAGIAAAKALSARWIELIEAPRFLQRDRLYPGTIALLEGYRTAGHRFTLVTARADPVAACRQIDALGLGRLCESVHVVHHRDGCGPGEAKAIASRGGESIERVVGDTEVDLAWAEALGVPFVALHSGFRGRDYWRRRHGIESHADLSAALAAAIDTAC